MQMGTIVKRFRIDRPGKFRLAAYDPAECCGLTVDKNDAKAMLAQGIERMAELQQRLYADDRWSVLIVLQAMDAAGKDSLIKHVMSGLNPQGVEVTSFKQPSMEDLDHDFLWRTTAKLPPRGKVGVFNRSYYEEVLICKVHDEYLTKYQRMPEGCMKDMKKLWRQRYESICDLEKHLVRNGTHVVKFFLNVSKREQAKRFLSRIKDPSKNWKFNEADLGERVHWASYVRAYEDAVNETATEAAPWYVIPADSKKNMRLLVALALKAEMKKLKLEWPRFPKDDLAAMARSERKLKTELR